MLTHFEIMASGRREEIDDLEMPLLTEGQLIHVGSIAKIASEVRVLVQSISLRMQDKKIIITQRVICG